MSGRHEQWIYCDGWLFVQDAHTGGRFAALSPDDPRARSKLSMIATALLVEPDGDRRDAFVWFDGAVTRATDLGVDSVDDIDATHFRLLVDPERVTRVDFATPGEARPDQVVVDLWATGAGRLLRERVTMEWAGHGGLPLTLRFVGYDGPISIEPPPARSIFVAAPVPAESA